jgi:RNA ligase (TIGR02306 family)
MRKLVTIQTITEKKPIEGADRIEHCRVNGWWIVAQKDLYQVGDKVLYYELDSLLPLIPEYDFLLKGSKPKKMLIDGVEREGIRLKSVRLRGALSQGLLMPCSVFPNIFASPEAVIEGTDVTDLLNVIKFEAPIPASLSGMVKGAFPSFIPKTDEERVQNIPDVIARHQNNTKFVVTEKIDGCSSTFYKYNGEFGVCSRNLELKETEGNTLWKIAKKYNLAEVLPEGYAVQGEIIGEGIQGNPLKQKGQDLYVFNVLCGGEYLNFEAMESFCEESRLKTVPILLRNHVLNGYVDEMLKGAEGVSYLNPQAQREGLVYRPMEEMQEEIGGVLGRFSFKTISNSYLLNVEE